MSDLPITRSYLLTTLKNFKAKILDTTYHPLTTIDTTVTKGSSNLVTSDAVYSNGTRYVGRAYLNREDGVTFDTTVDAGASTGTQVPLKHIELIDGNLCTVDSNGMFTVTQAGTYQIHTFIRFGDSQQLTGDSIGFGVGGNRFSTIEVGNCTWTIFVENDTSKASWTRQSIENTFIYTASAGSTFYPTFYWSTATTLVTPIWYCCIDVVKLA